MFNLHVIKNLAGTYSFCGWVPAELAYRQTNGAPLNKEQWATITHYRPGFVKGIVPVTFATEDEARSYAKSLGFKVE